MRHTHTKWVVRLVILLFFTGILPIHTPELYAQRSTSKNPPRRNHQLKEKVAVKRKVGVKGKAQKSRKVKRVQQVKRPRLKNM